MKMEEAKPKFMELIAQYSPFEAKDLTEDMRFREDLNFSSLDFMTFLGTLEDEFDVVVDEMEAVKLTTIGEAVTYLEKLLEE